MLSILFGLACAAGFVHLNRHHFRGYTHGCASRGGHRHHRRPGPGRGMGRRFLRGKLERTLRAVDATPEQSAEVRAAFDELHSELEGLKHPLRGQRRDLAEALRDDQVHDERVEVVFSAQRDALEGAQGALKRALDRVHAALDPAQRARIADLLAGQRAAPSGPYR